MPINDLFRCVKTESELELIFGDIEINGRGSERASRLAVGVSTTGSITISKHLHRTWR